MAVFTTVHLHNVPAGREADYAAWFDGPHRAALAALPGYAGADRYAVTAEQVMADIPQPWRFCSLYDQHSDDPARDIPALAPLLADAEAAGLIDGTGQSERRHTFCLHADWQGSDNWRRDQPFSGISVLLGNYVPGRYAEYEDWYEHIHYPEVTQVPGHVAMRRGVLSATQVPPGDYCPGDQLVLVATQTDDLAFTIEDFRARAMGRSPSGIAMAPRSTAASIARTVHYFRKVSGPRFWEGGVAYAGDLAAYGR